MLGHYRHAYSSDVPLIVVVFGSPHLKKSVSELDPLWEHFLDTRMAHINRHTHIYIHTHTHTEQK